MKKRRESPSVHLFQIRRLGHLLSQMMMPHLSIFIAWGFINIIASYQFSELHSLLGQIEEALIYFLLPLLIGYTGGKQVEEQRGGTIGAIATIGLIVATQSPQIIGAMLVAPLAVWSYLFLENLFSVKLKQGYEMLTKNILAGFIGSFWCVVSIYFFAPAINFLSQGAVELVLRLIQLKLLPLVSVLIEPLKILFFNNTINHGVFTPIGLSLVAQTGQSLLFLLETNPGPGLGILLAYFLTRRSEKKQTGAAIFVHLIGGIQEVYFPYVLMNPRLFVVIILSGVSGTAIFEWLNVGLTSPVSPGSLLLIVSHTPISQLFGLCLGILVSTGVAFALGMIVLRHEDKQPIKIIDEVVPMVGKQAKQKIQKIIVACDAGIGSSAMGASLIRGKLKEMNLFIPVSHQSVYQLENKTTNLVLVHPQLSRQVKNKAPSVQVVQVENFLNVEENIKAIQSVLHGYSAEERIEQAKVLETSQNISQIVLLYEKNIRGTQTMAIEMMRQKAQMLNRTFFFSKEAIETCEWREEVLYVVTASFEEKYQLKTHDSHLLVVKDLLKMSEFEAWIKESEADVFIS